MRCEFLELTYKDGSTCRHDINLVKERASNNGNDVYDKVMSAMVDIMAPDENIEVVKWIQGKSMKGGIGYRSCMFARRSQGKIYIMG